MKSKLIQKMNGEYELHHYGCGQIWLDRNGGSGWYKDREPLKSVDVIYTAKAAKAIMGNSYNVKKCDCFVKDMIQNLPLKHNRLGNTENERFIVLNNALRHFGSWVNCGTFDYIGKFTHRDFEVSLNSKPE